MASGILPACIHGGEVYFLFGKENRFADTPGFSDFGGGREGTESQLETAIREGVEEMTGFLGTEADIRHLISKNFPIDENKYRVHIVHYPYDDRLPFYYNNNARFLNGKLDPNIIRDTKIFEKSEIEWIKLEDIWKRRKEFRHYYMPFLKSYIREKAGIYKFLRGTLSPLNPLRRGTIRTLKKARNFKPRTLKKSKNIEKKQ